MQSASAIAAHTFRLDIKGAEIYSEFHRAGVPAILLKGRAFADLLYGQTGTRSYEDVDLLVAPAAQARAEDLLLRWGFYAYDPESPARQVDGLLGPAVGAHGRHSRAWVRGWDNLIIDLHDKLPQVGADPEVVWSCLAGHLATGQLAGTSVDVLDEAASALLITLHAAHHGPDWRSSTREDLKRAVQKFDLDCWRDARELAIALDAERSMGAGLGLTPNGQQVAEVLGLETAPSRALELLWGGAPWSATFVEAFLGERSLRYRARLLAHVLWPSPSAIRRGSSLARRSRRGLAAAYAVRLVELIKRLPEAKRHRGRP